MGSGSRLRQDIELLGLENFKKEILEQFQTEAEMFQKEREVVTEEFLNRPDVYNLRRGGFGGFDHINKSGIPKFRGKRHTEETKKRIAESLRGREYTEEQLDRYRESNWSHKDPEAHREHCRRIAHERQKNGKSEEEKKKISERMKKVWEDRKRGISSEVEQVPSKHQVTVAESVSR